MGAATMAAALIALFALGGPLDSAQAYQFYEDYPHFNHEKKDRIQLAWAQGVYDPFNPYVRWLAERAGEAASGWTTWTDVSLAYVASTNDPSDMHIVMNRYYDSTDEYAGRAYPSDHWPSTHHWKEPRVIALNDYFLVKWYNNGWHGKTRWLWTHEMGHALGLDHVYGDCPDTSRGHGIMNPDGSVWDDCGWDEPQSDEIYGIDHLYNDK